MADLATLYARRTSIDAAIARIEEGAQSYGVGSRHTQYALLNTYYAERERIDKAIAAAESGAMGFQVGVRVPAS
jgi:hypothetical protein